MKTSSAKGKGRRLQNWVRDMLIDMFKADEYDIKSAVMGMGGADVTIHNKKLRSLFPYSIECKNQEALKGLYKHYDQAISHSDLQPLLIIKMNRRNALAVVDAEYFIRMHDNARQR